MFYQARYVAPIVFLSVIFSYCNENPKNSRHKKTNPSEFQEPLAEMNKSLIKSDDEKIRRYMERNKLEMQESGTGLRYKISGEGTGEKARSGQYALVNYKLSLLDGTLCYSSEKDGPEEFLVGQDNIESGLHEGITYMRVGEKARFIMPPHLAHGLTGDENKIPARAILVYDIELLRLR